MKKTISIILCTVIAASCVVFSAGAKTVKVTVPKLKSVTAADTTTFKIKWSKVKGVKGYVLYCKKSGGKFKKLATLGKSKTSYIHKKLTNGKKYAYKIRAYKTVNGKKKYSKYSNVAARKCTNYLVNLYSPYGNFGYNEYKNGKSFKMGGDGYSNGFTLDAHGYAIFNLKGKYRYISFVIANSDEVPQFDETVSIISDDYCVGTYNITAHALPRTVKVNIENADKLEIRISDTTSWWSETGFANVKLYK